MNEEDTTIGFWNDYYDGHFVTFEELKELVDNNPNSPWSIKQYLDWRVSTNLIRFNYDPFAGVKINWSQLKKQVK